MNIETLPPEMWLKIPLPFMPWHPYISEITPIQITFEFDTLEPIAHVNHELGGWQNMVTLLKQEFEAYYIKSGFGYHKIKAIFKEEGPE